MRGLLSTILLLGGLFLSYGQGAYTVYDTLNSYGYTNIRQLPEVPEVVQGALISVKEVDDSGRTTETPEGNRFGKIWSDQIEIGTTLFPVNRVFGAEKGDKLGFVVIYSPLWVFYIGDLSPEEKKGLKNQCRFFMQIENRNDNSFYSLYVK